jgi:site-specific recombinase XerD
LIQKQGGGRWSKTHTCWYVPISKSNYEILAKVLKGKAVLKTDELKDYLLQKKSNTAPGITEAKKQAATLPAKNIKAVLPKQSGVLSNENEHEFTDYKNRLLLKGYSPSTVRTYCNEFHIFLEALLSNSAKELSPAQLQRYILHCINKLKLSENTIHSRMNALKFYYEQVLHKEKMFFDIPRPKKPLLLPAFFNQDEIAGIIKSVSNIKHKTMLMLAYSGRLRVSEVVSLKTQNIDSKRMSIFIERAKGKKDRIVPLSPLLLIMLREYWKAYSPDKTGYLFAGQTQGEPYSSRSLQMVLNAAKQKAGIMKRGSVHSLRHSFATHLLDRGTDVTLIMKLLGHNDLKTTLRYLHVTNRDMLQIISPLDDLDL